jgi:predicted Zn-dependent protease
VLARTAVAVIAVAAIGWLAVMQLDAWHYDRGIAVAGKLDDAKTIARAQSDFEAARRLTPDRTPDIGRALTLWTTGRAAPARALLEDVVAAEPDNLSAWTALGLVNAGKDPALTRRVAAANRRLDPLSAAHPSPRRPPPA